MTSASDEKWRPFIVLSVQGTGGNLTGPDQESRLGDQDTGSPGRPAGTSRDKYYSALIVWPFGI